MAFWNKKKKDEEESTQPSSSADSAPTSRAARAVRDLFNATVQGQQKAVQADQAVAQAGQKKLADAAQNLYAATVRGQQAATQANQAVAQAQTQRVQNAAQGIYSAYQQQQERAARQQMARQQAQLQAPSQRAQNAAQGLYSAYLNQQQSGMPMAQAPTQRAADAASALRDIGTRRNNSVQENELRRLQADMDVNMVNNQRVQGALRAMLAAQTQQQEDSLRRQEEQNEIKKQVLTADRLKNVGSAALTGTTAGYTGTARALYESGQNARDTENRELLAEYERNLIRAKADYEYYLEQAGGNVNDSDVVSQRYIVEDWQRKYDAMAKVVNDQVQQKATQAATELTTELEAKAQESTEKAKEGLGTVGSFAVDAAINMLEMSMDAVAGTATGGNNLIPMALRVFGQSASKAQQQGAGIERQLGYATATAGIEVMTEMMFDGLAGLYGAGAADEVTEAVIRKLAKTDTGRSALRLLLSMNEEGIEEVVSDALSPLAETIITGDGIVESYRKNFDISETMYNYLVGAAVAGAMNMARPVSAMRGNVESNETLASVDAAEQAYKELGVDAKEAGTLAWATVKTINGEELNAREQRAFDGSDVAHHVVEIMSGKQAPTARAEEAAQQILDQGNPNTQAAAETAEPEQSWQERMAAAMDRMDAQHNADNYDEDAAFIDTTGNPVLWNTTDQRHAALLNGRGGLNAAINDGYIRIKRGEGIELAVDNGTLSPQQAQAIRKLVDGFTGNTFRVDMDVQAGDDTNTIGALSFEGADIDGRRIVDAINREIRRNAQQTQAYSRQQTAQTERAPGLTLATEAGQIGDVKYDAVDYSALNATQRAVVDATEQIANALGLDVTVINARGNVGGAYMGGGKMYLNINSGMDLQGYSKAIAAASESHELVHWMQDYAKDEYDVLKSYVRESMGEERFNELVQEQMANQTGLTPEEAADEVVANACQPLLENTKAFEELARENPTLAQRILDFIRDFVDRIRSAFAEVDYNDDLPIFHAVQAMQDNYDALQEAYDKGILAARENMAAERTQTAANENTAGEGGVQYQDGIYAEGVGTTEDKKNFILVDPTDTAQIEQRMADAYDKAMAEGRGVVIASDLLAKYESIYHDPEQSLIKAVKAYYDAILTGTDVQVQMENGILSIMFENDGKKKSVGWRMSPEKAATFEVIKEMTENSVYAYSSVNRNANEAEDIPYFHYFVNNVEMPTENGIKNVPVKIQTRDIVTGQKPGVHYYTHNLLNNKTRSSGPSSEAESPRIAGNALATPVNDSVTDTGTDVKQQTWSSAESTGETVGVTADEQSESVAPIQFSRFTWNESDYVQNRTQAAKDIASALGISQRKAQQYIDSVNSVAKAIADDKTRLDYEASPNRSSLVGNTEYGGSVDFSTLCKKRRVLTGTFTAIQQALPNTALTAEEVLQIRKMMKDRGYEVSCGLCYVEGSRAKMGEYAKQFLDEYAKTDPEYLPNMAEINTPDGLEQIRMEHPEVYEAYEKFMNKLAQRKPKLYQLATEYKNEILKKFQGKRAQVDKYNRNGGLRLQSFSDFEIIHLIDNMQVIMDMSRVGLNGQAYTKVPEFAWAMGNTGLKINLSLIAAGVDENGDLILDEVEGMKRADAAALRNQYSDTVGTIVVVFNDEQLQAAMKDEFIDFIIPFHRSQWNKAQYALMGLPEGAKDYTPWQNESYAEPVYNKNGKPQRPDNYMPNEYWDFSKTGKENAETYLRMCAQNNRTPKFSNLLTKNEDGSYSLKEDGSTDGYWKLLIDFKMYNNDGVGVPQQPVQPIFNEGPASDPHTTLGMLEAYKGGHQSFPVAQDVVDDFVKQYKQDNPRVQYQTWGTERDTEYMSAVESGNERVQERMVQEAATSAGAIEDPKRPGKPLKLYHGTPSFGFTEFNTPTIFTTDNPSISSGYGGNRGYAEPRRISDVYTPDDGSFDTLKKNSESIMGRSIRKATDADRKKIIEELQKTAGQLQERMDTLWTDEAVDTLYKILGEETFTSDPDEYGYTRENNYDNVWAYMNTPVWDMTGYSAEEILNSYATEDIRNDLEKYFAYKGAFQRAISDHWDEIKGTPAEDLANFVRGYDIGDLAIYMQYSLMQSLREDAIIYEDTGKVGTEENLRESIERQKDLGSYELYGFAGDNQLVVDCKGKMWYNLTVPGLVEESTTTDSIMQEAKKAGYTSVLFKDLLDPAMNDYASNIASNVYVFFDPSQVKSADRVTYDDNGDVIPLSKRFQTGNRDIRFQTWGGGDIRRKLADAEREYMEHSDANDAEYDYRAQLDKIDELRRQVQEADSVNAEADNINAETDTNPTVESLEREGSVRRGAAYDAERYGDPHPERGQMGSDGVRVCNTSEDLEAELNDIGEARIRNDTGEYTARIRAKTDSGYLLTINRDGKRDTSRSFGNMGEAAAYAASYIEGQTQARTDAELDAEKSAPVRRQEPIEALTTGQVQDEAKRQKQNKAAEASTQSLRDRIRKTDEEIKALRRLEKTTGLTETQAKHKADLQETLEILNDELTSRKGRAKAKKEKVEVKGNKPVRSAAEAKNKLMDIFHTAAGQRADTNRKLDAKLAEIVSSGKITEQNRQDILDMLIDAGMVRQEAEQEFRDVRDWLRGSRIYVSEHDRADFGDDWDGLRKSAWANGIYLTNNESDRSVDSLVGELAETFGTNMFPTDDAASDMLRNLIEQAGKGRSSMITFAEAVNNEARMEHVDPQEIWDDLSRQTDETLRAFAEKAKLEVDLKDRTASMLATERKRAEDRIERMAQRRRESQIREKTMNAIKRLARLRGKAAPEVRAQIDEALKDIDTQARQLTINGLEDLQELARVYDDAKKAAGYVDEENPGNFISNPYIEQRLARLTQKHIGDMDIDDVIELGRLVSALENTVKTQNKMLGEEFDAGIKETAGKVNEEVKKSKGVNPGIKQALHKWFTEEMFSPRRFLNTLSGWTDGAMAQLADSLEKGQTRMLDFQRQAMQGMDPFMSKKENKRWFDNARSKNAKWTTYSVANGMAMDGSGFTGQTIEISPLMKVSLYLASLNEDNLRHIQTGGLVIPNKELYIKGDIKEAYDRGQTVKMQPQAVRAIASTLTQEEKTFAGYLQKFFDNQSKNAINEVSMQLDGFERAGVDNYFPIESSRAFLKSDVSGEARAATVEGIGSISNDRVHAGNPIILSDAYDTFTRQVDNVSRYYGYAIPIRDFQAVNNFVFHEEGNPFAGSIKDTINHKWGSGAEQYITKMLEDIQTSAASRSDRLSKGMSKVRSNIAGATLTFNPSVAVSQVASYPGAAQTVGWDGLIAGLSMKPVNEKLIEKYTPLFWYRSQGYSTEEIGDAAAAAKKGPVQKLMASKIFNWIQTMDRLTTKRLWAAAEYRVTKDTGLKPGSKELIDSGMDPYYRKVAEVYNRAIYDTQPNYTEMERAQILRSKSDLTKMLTMYKTVPLQYYNMMAEATGRLQAAQKSGNKAEIAKARKYALDTYGGLFAANAVYVLIKAAFKGLRGKDDDYRDEEGNLSLEATGKRLGLDLMETYAGSVIGGAEALSVAQYLWGDGNYSAPEINVTSYMEDLVKASKSIGSAIDDGDASKIAKAIKNAATTLSTGFGIPLKNAETYLLALTRWIQPQAALQYDSFFGGLNKGDLKTMDPDTIGSAASILMQNRTGVSVDRDATNELSRLYAAGFTDAIPTAIPDSFSYGGNEVKIKDRKAYRETWGGVVGDNLEELTASRSYTDADDKTKEAMIRKLYQYATVQARMGADPEYTVEGNSTYGWTEKADEAMESGMDLPTVIAAMTTMNAMNSDKVNGQTVKSKKTKVVEYIDSLNLDTEQKDALYELAGYESGLEQAPWHSGISAETGYTTGTPKPVINEAARKRAVEANYDLLTSSAAYKAADDQTKKEMIEKLNQYAEVQGMVTTDPDYLPTGSEGWTIWAEAAEKAGIDLISAIDYATHLDSFRADYNEYGKAISGSKKEKVEKYINGLDLTNDQKDVLYLKIYTDSSLKYTPWHGGKKKKRRSGRGGGRKGSSSKSTTHKSIGKITPKYSSGIDVSTLFPSASTARKNGKGSKTLAADLAEIVNSGLDISDLFSWTGAKKTTPKSRTQVDFKL